MPSANRETPEQKRRRAVLDVVVYGLVSGLLIGVLSLTEYRFLIVERSVEVYGLLIAALFAGVGIWLGLTLRHRKAAVVDREPAAAMTEPFVADDARRQALGITPRELEILVQIAAGHSNREIADRLCVSENTVKTHASRLFEKLGARRRTQAVQIGKEQRLIP